jgi:hypothetical protein
MLEVLKVICPLGVGWITMGKHVSRMLAKSKRRERHGQVANWEHPAMPRYINPQCLVDKPILLKELVEGDYLILVEGLTIGWIMRGRRAPELVTWYWSLTGPDCRNLGLSFSGDSGTLDGALEGFQSAYSTWLTAALDRGTPIAWQFCRSGPQAIATSDG